MRKIIVFPLVLLLLLTIPNLAFATQISNVKRLAGNDRYETAIQIAKAGWTQSDIAILAYGENYPDSLSAVPLAYKLNAPILLTDKDSLNDKTNTLLQDLKVKTIYLVGGTGVISSGVEKQLTDTGYIVKRLAGADRYETSIKIAEELGDVSELAVASGENYADALSIAPIAAQKKIPIILVPNDQLTSSIQDYISNKIITKSYIVADTNIMNTNNVINKFPNPSIYTGSDQYLRNYAVLNGLKNSYQINKLCVATGENFADALAGAVYAAKNNGAVILVRDNLPTDTLNFVRTMDFSSGITVFGGEGVVPTSLLNKIFVKLGFGTTNGQIYMNDYFGLSIVIPNSWTVKDNVALTKSYNENKDISNMSSTDASVYNDVCLLDVSKYSQATSSNCSILIQAVKNTRFKNGSDLLKTRLNYFSSQTTFTTTITKDIYTKMLGGQQFYAVDYDTQEPSMTIIHNIDYAIILNGYSFIITVYRGDTCTDATGLDQMLASMTINQ